MIALRQALAASTRAGDRWGKRARDAVSGRLLAVAGSGRVLGAVLRSVADRGRAEQPSCAAVTSPSRPRILRGGKAENNERPNWPWVHRAKVLVPHRVSTI